MNSRRTALAIEQKTNTTQRVSVGIIAVSIGLFTLALGTALFVSPSASFLFVPSDVTQQAAPSTATAVTLNWTAPGDDGNVGQAASYDLRYSTAPITADNFSGAMAVVGAPAPAIAGSTETMTVTGLQPATTYFFALTTTDEANNVSAMSNVTSKTTAALPQACIPTYTCSDWTSCADGTMTRTCPVTNGCPAGLDAPVTTQTCTVVVTPTPTMPTTPIVPPTPPTPGTGGAPVHVAKDIIVAGLAPGKSPLVRIIDPKTRKKIKEFSVFSSKDRNGVNVTAGDFNGDSQADIAVGTGAGSDPLVWLYSIAGKKIMGFNPYPTERRIGVAVASGDVNGDGVDELITVPAKASAQVRVWQYNTATKTFTQIAQSFVYDRTARQGFTVTAGDLDFDGRAEIVTTPRANGSSIIITRLDVNNKLQQVRRFSPYSAGFTSGLTVTIGDVLGTGRPSIVVVGGPNYYSYIKVFDINGQLQTHFYPLVKTYRNGLSLTTLDVNADGRDEIIAGNYQKSDPTARVFRYNGLKKKFDQIQNYLLFPRTIQTGLRLGAT
jgi:hypothetical protein